MTTLRIGNDYAFLVTEESWLRELFFHKLRFRKRDYFHHPLYKQKLWDGYINFFNKNNGRFLTGLLVEIQAALKELNVPYQIEDHRTIVDFAYENIDNQFLARLSPDGSGVTLHDYQVDITNKAIKYKRGIIQAPTGAGKTNIMVSIIQALKPGTPTLFLSKAADLIVQNYEELLKWGVPNVGCLGAGFKKPNVITCSTIDSLHHIERLLPHIRVLIVDEVHQLMSAKPLAAYKKMKNASVRLGISATPFKFGEKDYVQKWNVKGWFGPILLTDTTKSGKITTKDLQDRDILPPSLCTFYTINQPQIPWDVYGDAVTNGIANSWYLAAPSSWSNAWLRETPSTNSSQVRSGCRARTPRRPVNGSRTSLGTPRKTWLPLPVRRS
jgi:hypothetical protein